MPTLPATTVDYFLAGLESFMVRTGQGQHWGVTAVWLAGRPDAEKLARAWEQVHARHPMVAARLRRKWRGWKLVWETPGPAAAPPVGWRTLAEEETEHGIIQERLQGRASGQAIPAPLWLEVFTSAKDGRHLVLLTWRHALMDGTGVNLLLEKLASGACEADPPPPPAPSPAEGPGALYRKARPLVQRLQALTHRGCLSAWTKKMPILRHTPPEYRLIELSAGQSTQATTRLRELCGELFQMPFYAAVAVRALRRLHELRGWDSPAIHLQLPAQSRGRSRDLIFGNHMGTLPLFLETAALGSLPQAVAHMQDCYKDSVRNGLPQASEAMMSLASRTPVRGFIPMVRLTNCGQICSLFHSHTGAFLPGRAEFAGASIENVCTIPSVCAPPGLGLFFSDYGGKITATLAWRGAGFTAAEVETLAAHIVADLAG